MTNTEIESEVISKVLILDKKTPLIKPILKDELELESIIKDIKQFKINILEDQEFKIKGASLVSSILGILDYINGSKKKSALIEADICISKIIDNLGNAYVYQMDRYITINEILRKKDFHARSFELISEEQDYLDEYGYPYEVNYKGNSAILFCSNSELKKYNLLLTNPKVLFNNNILELSKEDLELMISNYELSVNGIILLNNKPEENNSNEDITLEQLNNFDSYSREAMRRGLWDGKDSKKFITKEELFSNIMRLIKKRKLK